MNRRFFLVAVFWVVSGFFWFGCSAKSPPDLETEAKAESSDTGRSPGAPITETTGVLAPGGKSSGGPVAVDSADIEVSLQSPVRGRLVVRVKVNGKSAKLLKDTLPPKPYGWVGIHYLCDASSCEIDFLFGSGFYGEIQPHQAAPYRPFASDSTQELQVSPRGMSTLWLKGKGAELFYDKLVPTTPVDRVKTENGKVLVRGQKVFCSRALESGVTECQIYIEADIGFVQDVI